jgi:hypothetical protein
MRTKTFSFLEEKMKQFTKTLLALVCVMALTAVFTGCPDTGGGGGTTPEKNPPADIVVKDKSNKTITSLTLALGDTEDLTVSATGATEYWWEISGGDAVKLSSEEGATTTVTADKTGTTTKIKVYAGNKDGSISKEIPVTVLTVVPQLEITKVSADGTEISETDKISLLEGESKTLTFEVKDENGTVITDATFTVISDKQNIAKITTTSGIKVEGVTEGEATITITAEKQGNKDSAPITREVKILSADTPILSLAVGSGGTGAWDGDTLTINDNDTLTLSAAGTVKGNTVTLTSVDWEVTGTAGIVTINETTGAVTVVKPGTTQIKVTAQAAEAEEPDMKTITLVVKRNYENVLYYWDQEENPLPSSGNTSLTSSGHGYTHPGSAQFKQQTNGLRVSMMRTFGAGVNDNGKIRLSNSPRLAIGQTANTQTAATNTWETDLGGQIDLYRKKVKLTIGYKDAVVEENRYALRVYVNNNGTGGTASMFGGTEPYPCVLYTWQTVQALIDAKVGNTADAGTVTLEIDTTQTGSQAGGALYGHANEDALAQAFIALHNQAQTAGNGITITDILLEWVEGTATPTPVLPLTVTADNESIPATITLEPNDTVALSATTVPTGAAFTWTISGTNTDAVTLSSTTTGSTTLTAVKAGTATITVKAELAGYRDATKTFNVKVEAGGEPFNPLIFQWDNSTQAWTSLSTGGNNVFYATGFSTIGVRAFGAAVSNDSNAGMLLGGKQGAGGQRLTIGLPDNITTANDTTVYNGQIDFTKKKVKVTITYSNVIQYASRVVLRVSVNNNTNTATNSNLNNSSQIVNYTSAQLQAAALTGATATAGTVEVTIDPASFTSAQQNLLKTGFLGIHTQHDGLSTSGTDATTGNWLTISKIRIEYID